MGCAAIVADSYGVSRFLVDVDRCREYWRTARLAATPTVVDSSLDWAASEGFGATMRRLVSDWPADWNSALAYRQRYRKPDGR